MHYVPVQVDYSDLYDVLAFVSVCFGLGSSFGCVRLGLLIFLDVLSLWHALFCVFGDPLFVPYTCSLTSKQDLTGLFFHGANLPYLPFATPILVFDPINV